MNQQPVSRRTFLAASGSALALGPLTGGVRASDAAPLASDLVPGKHARLIVHNAKNLEIETPLDRLQKGDMIVVKTGEVVPVDGFVREGMAMIDQHALTGESTPSEKSVGDRVFASTLMSYFEELFAATREQGLEGVVSKRLSAPYLPGRRSTDWLKSPPRCNTVGTFPIMVCPNTSR